LKFTLALSLSILLLGCFTAPAFADNITIQNASFEMVNPPTTACGPGCAWNYGPIPGWTTTGLGGSFQPGSAYFNVPLPNGSTVAWSDGGSISQTLGDSLVANTAYTLSVDVGHRLDGFATSFIIQLFAGSTLLNSITGSNAMIPLGTFLDVSFSYVSGVTLPPGNLSIVLSSAGKQTDFDNVRLTATSVSEPGSLTLLAAGLGLALFVFRRR
jgi:hypothetical protein